MWNVTHNINCKVIYSLHHLVLVRGKQLGAKFYVLLLVLMQVRWSSPYKEAFFCINHYVMSIILQILSYIC